MARLLGSLAASLTLGDYYGALQMYRSALRRRIEALPDVSTASVGADGLWSPSTGVTDVVSLLVEGVRTLSLHERYSEAVDLADMFCKSVLDAKSMPVCCYTVACVDACVAALSCREPLATAAAEGGSSGKSSEPRSSIAAHLPFVAASGKASFMKAVLRWAAKGGSPCVETGVDAAPAALLLGRLHLLVARACRQAVDSAFAAIDAHKRDALTAPLPPAPDAISSLLTDAVRQYVAAANTVAPAPPATAASADSSSDSVSGDAVPTATGAAAWDLCAPASGAPLERATSTSSSRVAYRVPPHSEPTVEVAASSGNPMHELGVWLASLARCCYLSEADLVIARPVLQLAAMGSLRDANALRQVYLSEIRACSAAVVKQTTDSPLAHFVKFLLLTLERDAKPLFTVLVDKYSSSISRDESLRALLAVIGKRYYGIVAPASGMSAMMDNLMGMFRGGEASASASASGGRGGVNPFAALMGGRR